MKQFLTIFITISLLFSQSAWGQDSNVIDDLMQKAEQGDPKSQYILSVVYLQPPKTPKKTAQAIEYLKASANNGFAEAQATLGNFYFKGILLQTDNKMAYKWLSKAAAQKNAEGQMGVAEMYMFGIGTNKNPELAFRILTDVANKGHYRAQYQLALMYGVGTGTKRNLLLAHKWLLISQMHLMVSPELSTEMGKKLYNDIMELKVDFEKGMDTFYVKRNHESAMKWIKDHSKILSKNK